MISHLGFYPLGYQTRFSDVAIISLVLLSLLLLLLSLVVVVVVLSSLSLSLSLSLLLLSLLLSLSSLSLSDYRLLREGLAPRGLRVQRVDRRLD